MIYSVRSQEEKIDAIFNAGIVGNPLQVKVITKKIATLIKRKEVSFVCMQRELERSIVTGNSQRVAHFYRHNGSFDDVSQ